MPIWDKVKSELDRAGKAAQHALDEGKLRLDAMRARQQADKAAQAIGYAVFRAKAQQAEIDAETYARLSAVLASHEAEAKRFEERLDQLIRDRNATAADAPPATASPSAAPPAPAPASAASAASEPSATTGAP